MQRTRSRKKRNEDSDDEPVGVKLLHTLEGHASAVMSLAFDPQGEILASGSGDASIRLWNVRMGKPLLTLAGHKHAVFSVAFDPKSGTLVSGSSDKTVKLWQPKTGKLRRTLHGHKMAVYGAAFDAYAERIASCGADGTIKLWDPQTGKLLRTLNHEAFCVAFNPRGTTLVSGGAGGTVKLWEHIGHDYWPRTVGDGKSRIRSIAFHRHGEVLASGDEDSTVNLWNILTGKLLRKLEGHTKGIAALAFSHDGQILASKSNDHTIRLWNCKTWEPIITISEQSSNRYWSSALAFHPTLPILASSGSTPEAEENEACRLVHLWELNYEVLLGQTSQTAAPSTIHQITGKIVLVGDHSVGKSALGYRLIHGKFREQASTHGQQFWVFPALGRRRVDGTDCEAILWDFAGQPDYRLVHALFVDNADLALILFDASDIRDPLHGVDFWLRQLQTGRSRCPTILVAAQADRGTSSLTQEELTAFCQGHGIVGPIVTSAATGEGIEELVQCMKSLITWEDKPATVTTANFKRIKDYVLGLKEAGRQYHTIVTPAELRERLQSTDAKWRFTDAEMLTAVGHLENYGYVKRLRTSKGEERILLQPERLNNLASSFVLEARRNPRGLGALEEKLLLSGEYDFPELSDLDKADRDVFLDSAALLFLEHNVCFRETDPLRKDPYLVFPELINLKKPLQDDAVTEDGVSYTVSGPTENVFASLVVLLGYTHTFTRTAQWHNNARYEMGNSLVCGFRQETERDGELDFVLCFGPNVGPSVRTLFQGLFESFLARRNLSVRRLDPISCKMGHFLNRAVLREAMQQDDRTTFCSKCGQALTLPAAFESIQLTQEAQFEVESQRRAAEQRTRFEQAVFSFHSYIAEQNVPSPECFISYAWGVPEHERWVEKRLATDLQKAGIEVLLDRWHNAKIGASITRFVERIEECERVIVVATPLYRQKAKNLTSSKGSVVAAEYDLTGIRLVATEDQKRTVLPVLLAGEESTSLPALLRGRVYADFRNEEAYFKIAFDLILSIYDFPPNHPAVVDLRELLQPPGTAFSH